MDETKKPAASVAKALQADDEDRPLLPRGGLTRAVDAAFGQSNRERWASPCGRFRVERGGLCWCGWNSAAHSTHATREHRQTSIGVDIGKPMPRTNPDGSPAVLVGGVMLEGVSDVRAGQPSARDRMIRASAEASGTAHAMACALVPAHLEQAPICCPGDMRAPALSVSEGALWAEIADDAADRRWAEICAAAGVERRPEPPTPSSSQAPRFPPSFSRGPRRRP